MKFISTLLQKFHQKSCSLLEQGEATPPKISSRKNHQRPNSFCRTPCMHCCCSKFRKFSFSVVFVRQFLSRIDSALGSLLAAPPSCPELLTRAWSLPGIGGTLACPRRRLLQRRDLPWRPTGDTPRQNAVQRHPKPLGSPRVPAVPAHARGTVAVARQARNVLPAADVPRHPVPSSSPSAPSPSPFSA